jgi:hypothetical protein
MSDDTRSPHVTLFWVIHGLPRWEQRVFQVVNLPFSFLGTLLSILLFIPFQIFMFLSFPFTLIVLAGSLLWLICLGLFLALSWLTERIPLLRPLTFTVALPFLVLAHLVNSVIPAPSESDMQSKIAKWDLIEAFPFTWSLFRTLTGGSPAA